MPDLQGFEFQLDDGQTPLDPDEARGLKLPWVATRGDLNDAEGANIFTAMRWAAREIRKKDVVVPSEDFLRQLHSRMFGDVWEWAGQFRMTERNIGVAPHQIAMQLHLAAPAGHLVQHGMTKTQEVLIAGQVFRHRLMAGVELRTYPDNPVLRGFAGGSRRQPVNAHHRVEQQGKGRHDPCVVPRAVPIVEAMAALVIADYFLLNKMYS